MRYIKLRDLLCFLLLPEAEDMKNGFKKPPLRALL